MGHGAAKLVRQNHPSTGWTEPIMTMGILLIGYACFLRHRKDREEARAIREMPIGEKYRDDIEDI